jgi:excisionase family DNA binding protein
METAKMLNADLIHGAASAAEYTGLTERTIYHLVETQQIPVIRKGRSLFFRKSELEAAFRSEVE